MRLLNRVHYYRNEFGLYCLDSALEDFVDYFDSFFEVSRNRCSKIFGIDDRDDRDLAMQTHINNRLPSQQMY